MALHPLTPSVPVQRGIWKCKTSSFQNPTTIPTNRKWTLLYTLPNLLHAAWAVPFFTGNGKMRPQIPIVFLYRCQERGVFPSNPSARPPPKRKTKKYHHVLISISVWTYCMTFWPNVCPSSLRSTAGNNFQSGIVTKGWKLNNVKQTEGKCQNVK